MRRAPLLLLCGLLALFSAGGAGAGDVSGRVSLALEGARLAELGPIVVFLEPEGGGRVAAAAGRRPAIHQHNARFEPDFLVVTAGQTVEMPNDDTIFHNVFSFSRPNDFDLGVYPAGELRTVTFAHPGLVKLYCSIHESMSGAVLVTPSPWFARAGPDGEYRIPSVPPGRYGLRVWNEMLPLLERDVVVGAGTARVDLELGRAERTARSEAPASGERTPAPGRAQAAPASPAD
jgi:plastocyanin